MSLSALVRFTVDDHSRGCNATANVKFSIMEQHTPLQLRRSPLLQKWVNSSCLHKRSHTVRALPHTTMTAATAKPDMAAVEADILVA